MEDDFARLRELFDHARTIENPDTRLAWVLNETSHAPTLRRELVSLLESHEGLGGNETAPVPEGPRQWVEGAMQNHAHAHPTRGTIGQYTIKDLLGRGGMSVVYRASQEHPPRDVALKQLAVGALDAASLARFDQEAAILGQLRHEGIAQIYEFGTESGPAGERLPFIAMELVEGRSLTDYVREQRLGRREQIDLILQVLDAVATAHQQGIIHRDLKPANILVNDRGRAKLLDFGVARALGASDTLTRTGDVVGTLLYMSPEQVARGLVDTRTDIFSLGLIAYEVIGGAPPRDLGLGPARLIDSILHDEIPSLAKAADGVDLDLSLIIAKSLSRDADRRYATADAFAADLRRYLQNEPVSARSPTLNYQVKRFVQRNRVAVLATGLVFASLATGLVLAVLAGRKAEEDRRRSDRLAASRLHTEFILRTQSAVASIQVGKTRAARTTLAQVPQKHRGWVWRQVAASLDESTSVIRLPARSDQESGGRTTIRGHVVVLGADGTLSRTDETLSFAPTEYEIKNPRISGPVVIHAGDGPRVVLSARAPGQPGALTRGREETEPASPSAWSFHKHRTGGLTVYTHGPDAEEHVLLPQDDPVSVALHPARDLVLIGTSHNTVHLVDLKTKETLRSFRGHHAPVTAVAWSSQGDRFASIDHEGTVHVVDPATGELLAFVRSPAQDVSDLAFVDGDRALVGLGQHEAWSWLPFDAQPTVLRHHGGGQANYVYAVDVSSDGRRIASAGWEGTVRVSSAVTGDLLATLDTQGLPATDVAFLTGGRHIAVCGKGALWLFDATTGERLGIWLGNGFARRMAVNRTRTRVVWRSSTEGELSELVAERDDEAGVIVPKSPTFTGGNLRERWKHEMGITFGPNEASVLQALRQWPWCRRSLDDGKSSLRVGPGTGEAAIADLVLHPDGRRLIAAGPSANVTIYDLESGEVLDTLIGHSDKVFCVALHPDGRTLASGANDETLRIWDLDVGGESIALKGHEMYVHDLAFSPDGSMLISASGDGTVRLWPTEPPAVRAARLVAERSRLAQLRPHVAQAMAAEDSPQAVLSKLEAFTWITNEAERATARDLVLLLSAEQLR